MSAGRADVVCIASFNADLVCRVARPIARGETLLAQELRIEPGGKGSNAAVACARQGARVALIARIGDDDFGRIGLDLWAREGIDAGAVERAAGERSGIALIHVFDDGDNSIAVAPGAGTQLGASQVKAAAPWLRAARVVMASCEVPLPAVTAAFALARDAGAITVLNPAPAMPLPDALWALVDVLTPNRRELAALAERPETGDPAAAAEALIGRRPCGPGCVLVTLGAQGCSLFRSGEAPQHWAGHDVRVIDTIGAGDTFTGALAAALARGESIAAAAQWANAAAALSVQGSGATGGMPSRADVAALLARPAHS